MTLSDTSLLTVAVAGVAMMLATICVWVLDRRRKHELFSRHGIPGPKPDLMWGNWMQLKEDKLQVMEHWIKTYGKVFGFYKAAIPYIVLTDLDMIKQCFIKEANVFYDRPDFIVNVEPFASCIMSLGGQEWKKVRTVLNPSFSAAKMKMMTQIMRKSSNAMLEVLDDHVEEGRSVDMFKIAQGFALDVIAKCALAWQVDCQKNPTDKLLKGVRHLFEEAENPLVENATLFPTLSRLIEWLYPYSSYYKVLSKITQNVRSVIALRRKGQAPPMMDMLQVMLDAQECPENSTTASKQERFVFEDRYLLANCFIFLAAGYETSATSLSFVMHVLAKYPEEQHKVYGELVEVFPDVEEELTYDGVQQLKRLDMMIKEALRVYPPVVLFVSRACREDATVLGQFFPAGVNILVPTWHIHHDPELWPDPFRFDPDRFADGHSGYHPAAYLTFGLGPRVCIGKRFALLELKLAVCTILRKYRVVQCDETQDPLNLVVPSVVINPEKGVNVRFEPR